MRAKCYLFKSLAAVLLLMLFNSAAIAQQLVQSFVESNKLGESQFGVRISIAGDVNNDGYDDILISAPYYDDTEGKAYLYLGGSTIDTVAAVTFEGDDLENVFYGVAMSGVGDVNGDGYDDIMIGEYGYNSWTGRAFLYFGGSNMNSGADLIFEGTAASELFGYSIAGAGDINNDGYDDILIGVYGYGTAGSAFIYYGGSDIDTTADVILEGPGDGSIFGYTVSGAGDLNNDGYDDVIVGDRNYNDAAGRAYIYYGGAEKDTLADVILEGELRNNFFSMSLAAAGDINGDGYDDVLVGSRGYNSSTGRAYIYYGGAAMDSLADVVMNGENTYDYFAGYLSGAGDVNGDNYNDVLVSSYGYGNFAGAIYVFFGGADMDSVADAAFYDQTANDWLGTGIAGFGDVNGDGYDDIVAGAYGYNSNTGRAYIFYGSSNFDADADVILDGEGKDNRFGFDLSGAGDLNNDGYDDIIVGAAAFNSNTGRAYIYWGGSSVDSTAALVLDGENAGDYFGYTVSGAGDLNGDGYADVVVNAMAYNSVAGKVYVYYGGSNMDASADLTMEGESTGIYFGYSVAGAGDVNNDGYDDLIAGAPYYNGDTTGRAYIYFGGSSMDTVADVIMDGETGIAFGASVSGAGDLNRDGYDDVVVGLPNTVENAGNFYIYFGGSDMDGNRDAAFPLLALRGDLLGSSVSGAGDVNGDGYDDFLVGAYGANSYTGEVYVYYGGDEKSIGGISIIEGKVEGGRFGYDVSGIGDVNGDNYDDFIVGAYGLNNGVAYIYYGGETVDTTADIVLEGESEGACLGFSVAGAGDVNGDGYDEFLVGAYNEPMNGKVYLYMAENRIVAVTIASFSGALSVEDEKVSLSWSTSDIAADCSFELQRCYLASETDTTSWAVLESIDGDSTDSYTYVDSLLPSSSTVYYRLKFTNNINEESYSEVVSIDLSVLTGIEESNLPTEFGLSQNYPNPFNPTTTIEYQVPENSNVTIKVYDLLGREVTTLVNENKTAGYYTLQLNGSHLASGVYIYRMKASDYVSVKKLVLLK